MLFLSAHQMPEQALRVERHAVPKPRGISLFSAWKRKECSVNGGMADRGKVNYQCRANAGKYVEPNGSHTGRDGV